LLLDNDFTLNAINEIRERKKNFYSVYFYVNQTKPEKFLTFSLDIALISTYFVLTFGAETNKQIGLANAVLID
jgi:hypothetical protein